MLTDEASFQTDPPPATRFLLGGLRRSFATGPYELNEDDSQRAFDRDFRAATTRGPRRARLRGGVRAERPGRDLA